VREAVVTASPSRARGLLSRPVAGVVVTPGKARRNQTVEEDGEFPSQLRPPKKIVFEDE
jgi:hypothetical protein